MNSPSSGLALYSPVEALSSRQSVARRKTARNRSVTPRLRVSRVAFWKMTSQLSTENAAEQQEHRLRHHAAVQDHFPQIDALPVDHRELKHASSRSQFYQASRLRARGGYTAWNIAVLNLHRNQGRNARATIMHVLVIGSGYVGLVAAVGFAEAGHKVLGIDVDVAKIEKLRQGVSPIYEPGLEEWLARHQASGQLSFSLDLRDGIREADAAFICVGTPQSEDGSADLQYVLKVAEQIGAAMALRPGDAKPLVVVDKSTVPVGTAARVGAAIAAHTDRAFEVVSNPEFLREGCAIDDFVRPDRVVVGCRSEHAEAVMKELYGKFLAASGGLWLRMDPPSAELTKYAANAMLALRISFINEIAGLCERVGADVQCVRDGIGSDHRIGRYFLNPGPGFGGSCFPKDLQALLKVGRENGQPLRALEATVEANRHQKQVIALKVKQLLQVQGGRARARWPAAGSPCGDWRSRPTPTTSGKPWRWS